MTALPPPEADSSPSGQHAGIAAGPPSWLGSPGGHYRPGTLGPQQLAWLGDAVWELHQRLAHCHAPARPQDLHRAVVARVRAAAQARALERLEPLLNEAERDWVRRGRNRAGRGPRSVDAAVYGRATGFETMLGWLYLCDPGRLAALLDQLEEPALNAPPASPPVDRPREGWHD